MKFLRIQEAKPLDGHRVQLTLTDGRVIQRDVGSMLAGPVFSEIRSDQARFRGFPRRRRHSRLARRRGPAPRCSNLGRAATA